MYGAMQSRCHDAQILCTLARFGKNDAYHCLKEDVRYKYSLFLPFKENEKNAFSSHAAFDAPNLA